MKKLIFCLAITFTSIAQAQLISGSIGFVGFNSDSTDGFAFVTFVDIPAKTKIYFRDDEWNGSSFNNGEAIYNWVSDDAAIINAGTVIKISAINKLGIGMATIGTIKITGASAGLAGSDEAIFAYIGTDSLSPGTFLTAIANG